MKAQVVTAEEALSMLRTRLQGNDAEITAVLDVMQRSRTTSKLVEKLTREQIGREVNAEVLRAVERWPGQSEQAMAEGRRACMSIIISGGKSNGWGFARYRTEARALCAVSLLRWVFGESYH